MQWDFFKGTSKQESRPHFFNKLDLQALIHNNTINGIPTKKS